MVGQLRQYCPWTAALTPTSLRQYLVEECYELLDAVEQVEAEQAGPQVPPASGKQASLLDELRGELGDVLFQVVLHAEVQHERGAFGLGSVVEGLTAKLVRRNPHVFCADGSMQEHFPASIEDIMATWQAVKSTEKPDREPFEGIPGSLPALAFATKSLSRAAAVGVSPALGAAVDPDVRTAEELGDRLFALAAAAVGQGIDPELALRQAVRRFQASATGAT
nr:MazG nucleotide pyrophosphohydrolase domain-containing protein [Arthrobacter sp. H41]